MSAKLHHGAVAFDSIDEEDDLLFHAGEILCCCPPIGNSSQHRGCHQLKWRGHEITRVAGTPFTTAGFARMLQRVAEKAGLDIKVHAHMLRHACGFKLANDGVDTRSLQSYLGHVNIQHTVRYTELSPTRFKNFWKD
jgi:integrase